MRLRTKMRLALASVAIFSSGCDEPGEIVPVAPPGFELARVPVSPQGEGAQALGEQGSSTAPTKPAQNSQPSKPALVFDSPATPIGQPTTTPSGLVYETMQEGTGAVAKSGDPVTMHYTGTFADGKKFDSSLDRNQPFSVVLGMRQVIAGWDEGIPGMKVGERRKLVIPPNLAYGAAGRTGIPANSTLTFEVELLSVK